MTQRNESNAIHQPAQGHEAPVESHCSSIRNELPHDTHCEPPYHRAVHRSHQAIQKSRSRSKILAESGVQPLDPTYHRAIHWTPSNCDSRILEPPAESPGDSNSRIFELPCEPTEPPHELASSPYRGRFDFMNVPAYDKS